MAVTGFLSMWLPNIPTTAMMIPIAAAVLKELDNHRLHLRELKRGGGNEGERQCIVLYFDLGVKQVVYCK